MRAEEKNTKQKLVPLKDEALRVIGELVVFQSMVKKVAQDSEQRIMTLTVYVVEESVEKEVEVKKEVTAIKETLQNFMEAWKGVTQQD